MGALPPRFYHLDLEILMDKVPWHLEDVGPGFDLLPDYVWGTSIPTGTRAGAACEGERRLCGGGVYGNDGLFTSARGDDEGHL